MSVASRGRLASRLRTASRPPAVGTKLKHESVLIRCRLSRNASGVATLVQRIEAEKRMRDLLEEAGLPQPDYVEYGFTCIRLLFNSVRQVVIIDIDEPEDP